MVVFPNCKINLGLNIIRKREDGYHDIETVFYPLPLHDAVEITELNIETENIKYTSNFHFNSSGLLIDTTTENNLCIRAYQLLNKDFTHLPSVKMYLHKIIPMGSGLGGGSADAAFTLKLLNEKFELNLSQKQLLDYALQLGSDCPFFIINKPCFAKSRGEDLQTVPLDLSKYHFYIVHPGIHISTTWAFSQIQVKKSIHPLKEIVIQNINSWKNYLRNDFEEVIIKEHPQILSIKNQLYNSGAIYACMTGSGSAVFGIFENEIPEIKFPENYSCFKI